MGVREGKGVTLTTAPPHALSDFPAWWRRALELLARLVTGQSGGVPWICLRMRYTRTVENEQDRG